MKEIEIPGGKAIIRDKLVSERQYRILKAAYMGAMGVLRKIQDARQELDETGLTPEEIEAQAEAQVESLHLSASENMTLMELQDAAIVAFLHAWTLNRQLPNLDTVGDLDLDLYKALADATSPLANEALSALPDYSETPQMKDKNGLDFPTGSSKSSDGRLKEQTPKTSTPKSSKTGKNTSTEPSIQE